jgi:hypothetical protein
MDINHLSFAISFTELDAFLTHWSSRYRDGQRDAQLYELNIGKGADLKTDWKALKALFTWKNGTVIAPRKLVGIRKHYFKVWTEEASLEQRYLDPNNSGGPIWNIFYLHCRFPDRYPIYDQHAYRAMIYIQTGSICQDLTEKSRGFVYDSYREKYRPFVDRIVCHGYDLRKVDRALYTFGQFLKRAKPYLEPPIEK